MSFLRRFLAMACLLAAVWTAVVTVPAVYQVKLVDFTQEKQRAFEKEADTRRLMTPMVGEEITRDLVLYPEARGSLDAFIRKETKGRLYQASGSAWPELIAELRGVASGKAPAEARGIHAGRNGLPEYAYYALTEEPLAELGGTLNPNNAFTYVRVDAGKPRYLAVTYLQAVNAQHSASLALLFPRRAQSPWWLLAAFLLYVLLPWPQARKDTLCYSRGRSMIGPDIMGFLFAAGFYALALLVVSRDSNMSSILEAAGWTKVTLWSLLFTLPGLAMLAVGQWYEGFTLQLLPDGLRLTTWGIRTRTVRYTELAEARTYTYRHPKWLITAMFIASFIRPRQAVPLLIMLRQTFPGLELLGQDGRVTRFIVSYFPRWQRVLVALQAAGIPLSPELRHELDDYTEPVEERRPFPRLASVTLILLVAMGIGVGGWYWLQRQYAPPPIPKRSLTSKELAAEHEVLVELQRVNDQLTPALSNWEHAPAEKKEAAYAEYQRLLDRSLALSDRFDEINEGRSELAPPPPGSEE